MRVLIYGGRDWNDQQRMDTALDVLHARYLFTEVINGGQATRNRYADGCELYGADWQAAVWAQKNGIPIRYFYADWHQHGKAAGPIRNERMLVEGRPHMGVQFPGGKGTRDMRKRLDGADILVIEPLKMTATELVT